MRDLAMIPSEGNLAGEEFVDDQPEGPNVGRRLGEFSERSAPASLRQVMEQHRANPVCASCQMRMDPLGFSLENYEAVGSRRDQDGKVPIDPSGVLPDGRTFKGADGLKAILRSDKGAFANGMASKLLTYGLGRGLESHDRPVINQAVKRLTANDYRFSSRVLEIVNSFPFQMQRGAGPQ
jgi:hypothetical protein